MEITNTTSSTQTAQATNSPNAMASDYETFLKMLTVQMTNQDPLNPVESSDYAVQLATFSSVEQQVLTNDHLLQMQSQLSMMSISQLAGWVGMDAQAHVPGYFDGNAVEVATNPDSLADTVELLVIDGDGREISRLAIGTGSQKFAWDGLNNAGQLVPEGLYSFLTESYANGTSLGQQSASAYSRIVEARATDTGVDLVLEGGAVVASGEIVALREPG